MRTDRINFSVSIPLQVLLLLIQWSGANLDWWIVFAPLWVFVASVLMAIVFELIRLFILWLID